MASFTAHVVYYEERKVDLLLDCLVPVARHVAAELRPDAVFLERHWRFGPHVRLSVDGAPDGSEEWFARECRPRIDQYLADVPSRAHVDTHAYLRLSAQLAAAELVLPPYGPVWRDNSVVMGRVQQRTDLYGPAGAAAKTRFLAACVEPVAALLTATRHAPAARLDVVFRLLALLATTYDDDIGEGSLSYRSHLEDFLHRHDPAGTVRARFAAKYASVRDEAVAVVRDVVSETVDGVYEGTDDVLCRWSALFRATREDLAGLSHLHEIDEHPTDRYLAVARNVSDEAAAQWNFSDGRSFGGFHLSLRSLDYMIDRQNVHLFSVYRWLVNLFYLAIPLLDVSPLERYFLTFAAAEAADEVSGTTWKDRLEGLGADMGSR